MNHSFKKPKSLFSPAGTILKEIEQAIAALYHDNDFVGVRPRFSMALIGLSDHGPMTIRDLAEFTDVTHGAMSQSVKGMKDAGLIKTEPGSDARSVLVILSAKGRNAIPFLEAEWDATEAMLAELDDELNYPLTQVISDMQDRLSKEPLKDRLARHMRKKLSK